MALIEPPQPMRIVLSLDPTAPSPSGWLHSDTEAPRRFSGWLELASVITHARRLHTVKPIPPGEPIE